MPVTCAPLGGLLAAGGWGSVPGGGVALNRGEGRLVSGAVPPPAVRPVGWAAGAPRPVCPGCGWCGCGDPAPARKRVPLQAKWGWRKGVPGGVPFAGAGCVRVQALLLLRLPALQAGCRGPLPTCCGRGCAGVGAQHCPLGLHAPQGAACPLGGLSGSAAHVL